jgi:hypothetical protein
MTFAETVKADVEQTHADWARNDITRRRRTVTSVDAISSTPTVTTAETTIIGVLTVVTESLQETFFGGMVQGDGVLEVLPAVDIVTEDEIVCDGVTYRCEEIRDEDVQGTVVQRYCRLVRVKP